MPGREDAINQDRKRAFPPRFYIGAALTILLLGLMATLWVARAEDARMRDGMLVQARMVAAGIDQADLAALNGTPADVGQPVYQALKARLIRARQAYELCRFVYLAGIQTSGAIFFYVDSEPPDSENHSPPGEIYAEASDAFRQVFQTGLPFVEGPLGDRWGNWVSALVPIEGRDAILPVAVLGIDIDARDWTHNILMRCAPVVALTLVLLTLLTVLLILVRRSEQAHRHIAASEARVAQSESAYRNIVMSMLDIFFRVDAQGRVAMLSPSAARLFGYDSIDRLLGKKMEAIYAQPHQRAELLAALAEKGEIQDFELGIRHRDGGERLLSVSVRMLYDAGRNPDGYEGIARDITDRKRAEQALKRSEEKYRNMIESMEEGYFELDTAGHLTFFNNAFCRLAGSAKEACAATDVQILFPAEAVVRLSQMLEGHPKPGSAVRISDLEIRHPEGGPLYVDLSASPIIAGDGSVVGCRGLLRDITDRKRGEQQRQELDRQIQRAQKMETIGSLAGGVAHDLNNILSGIVSYPDLVLMQLAADSPLRRPLESIKSSGLKATAIVQDLLTLARRGVTVAEAVSLNDLIVAYFNSPEFLKMKSFHPGVTIHTDLDEELMNIMGSPVHLSKTIMNLVSNAAEAMPDGGAITITTRSGYVDHPIKGYDHVQPGDYTVLTVADSGTGISPQDQTRIFEPFFSKKKMGRSGTGLGLSVVWATVQDHKGYIDLQSRQGQGSTFTLYFPVTRTALPARKRPPNVEEMRGNGEKILVVDDLTQQREIATAILTQLGYVVVTVSSGEAAIQYLQNNPVDMV
ncbi:MAG: PAS domain S-box protein, partial [Desulfobacterales bacterium]|nr:PAS domain S-box protein [Desulfobacterales bacterium]